MIEILSPANKRPGHEDFEAYRRKRRHILGSSVHLMEVDLLRQGQRPPLASPLPEGAYFIFLSREGRRPEVEIWPIKIQDSLPIVPVPLLAHDPDVPLDLNDAIHSLYDERSYDLRIDYTQAPPAADFSAQDAHWIRAILSGGRA